MSGGREPATAAPTARRGQLLGALFLLVAVVAGGLIAAGVFGGADPADRASSVDGVRGVDEVHALVRDVPQHGITLGRPDAPATIVAFADLKCSACRAFALGTLPALVDRLVRPGRANLELRLIGLPAFRPDNLIGRRAVYNLAAAGRAWPLAELTYYNQQDERDRWITPALLQRFADASPDLRGTTVSVRPTPAARRLAAQADALARRLEVRATPTFFVRPNAVSAPADGGPRGTVAPATVPASRYDRVDVGGFADPVQRLAQAVDDATTP